MFRLLLRSFAINLACVYLATQILSGVMSYVGGFWTIFSAAVVISIANLLVRPIINLLLLPLNLITLGLFRWVANLIILYLVTRIVTNLTVQPFSFPGLDLKYIIVPEIHFSAFGAFIITTLIFTIIFHFLYWLLQE